MSGKMLEIARQALSFSDADETEVIVTGGSSALTRFANNVIHQNVAEEDRRVSVRVAFGRKVGSTSTNDTSKSGLRKLVERASDIARNLPEKIDFPGLPDPRPVAEVEAYSRETAALTPARRADMAAEIIAPSVEAGANASGAVSDRDSAITVLNCHGVHASARSSEFRASAVVEKDSGFGYAGGISWSNRRVDTAHIGRVALGKCLDSVDPVPLEPDRYTVVLEPQAVAELIAYTAYMGFGAQSFAEGRSFMSGRIGLKLMHESVSIWDDGLDEDGMPATFDMEGVPKQRVNLIENGYAKGVVRDTYYGAKEGVASTGHSLGPSYPGGPLPTNLFMAAGQSSIEEMIGGTDRGLLVTRFHYTNIADPAHAVLTGLTRDGTFLIEGGCVSRPVKNLRFTESMTDAFSAVEALSAERSLEPSMLGAILVPAVKISAFTFTGATEF